MLFKPSEEEILTAREQRFPNVSSFSIKNAIFKISGTDTLSNIDIILSDYLGKPKIFKNEAQKNYIKFKVFEISSEEMKKELISATDIIKIEEIIKKYGFLYTDLFACTDFIGSKTNANEHIVEDESITLNYKVNFAFPKKDIKYLSIGMIFYFNLNDYIVENKVSQKYILKEALSSNLKIIDLFDSNGKNINPDVVQDLRVVNQIFKNKDALNSLTDKINVEQKILKIQSHTKKAVDNSQFFSNLYNSRDEKGNSNLMFFVDYNKIIENYSAFSDIIKNSAFPSEIYKKCKISSLKFIRRQVEKSGERYVQKKTPVENLISTSQSKKDDSVNLFFVENDLALIRETDVSKKFKCLEVVDKTIYKSKRSLYQYGVEINVNDGFYSYLKDIRDQLNFNLKIFKDYLQETNKVLKNGNQINQKGIQKEMDIGYYDPVINSFSKRFNEEVFPKIYEQEISKSISFLLSSMELFGLLKITDKTELLGSLIAMASPASANADTISYFIKTFEKFINQIEHSIKNVSNTSFSLEYWFEKQIIDASENPGVGYGYFDKKSDGISRVSNIDLESKIATDSLEYVQANSSTSSRDEYKYSSVSPSFIKTLGKKLVLSNIKNIPNNDFKDLELNIKRYNSLGDSEPHPFLDDDLKIKDENKAISNLKTEKLMNKFSFLTSNRTLKVSDQIKIKQKANENPEKINTDIDPQLLFLGMLKNTYKKNVFNNTSVAVSKNINGILVEKEQYRKDIPTQIYSLLKKNDTLFSQLGIKYLSDLENNSKFLLLYNTIHQIEILKDATSVRDENWSLLTKQEYSSIPENTKILCRLKLFQDVDSHITGFSEVAMPIYDAYFILEKNVSQQEINKKIEFIRKTFDYSVAKIFTNIQLNSTTKVLTTSPIIKGAQTGVPAKKPILKLGEIQAKIPTTVTKIPEVFNGVAIEKINIPSIVSKLSPVVQPSITKVSIPTVISKTVESNIAAKIVAITNQVIPLTDNQKTSVIQNGKLNNLINSVNIINNQQTIEPKEQEKTINQVIKDNKAAILVKIPSKIKK